MRRARVPRSRRRAARSTFSIIHSTQVRQAARIATPYRQVTDLTREGATITLSDLREITRVLSYNSSTSAAVLARLPIWQGGQIQRYGAGVI